MQRSLHILLFLLAFGCSNDPDSVEQDVGDASDADEKMVDVGGDFGGETDLGGEGDIGPSADAGVLDVGPLTCADYTPAACMEDPACTLDGGCVERGIDEPFQFLQTGAWVGTAQSTGQQGLPEGEIDAVMMLHRDNERSVRGVVSFPEFDIDHAVWGGVGPGGELGLYFGTPRCDDPRCDGGFAAAYDVGGLATDLAVTLEPVLVDSDVTDFQTFVDMRLTPSDGFKPVGPIIPRDDELVARWLGDMVAVDESGQLLDLMCDFEIANGRSGYQFVDFDCSSDAAVVDATSGFQTADAASIAYADGLAWFATGTDPDELAFVGTLEFGVPWEGVVARRGDLLDGGVPVAPEDVPLEAVRGTFQFYAFESSR